MYVARELKREYKKKKNNDNVGATASPQRKSFHIDIQQSSRATPHGA